MTKSVVLPKPRLVLRCVGTQRRSSTHIGSLALVGVGSQEGEGRQILTGRGCATQPGTHKPSFYCSFSFFLLTHENINTVNIRLLKIKNPNSQKAKVEDLLPPTQGLCCRPSFSLTGRLGSFPFITASIALTITEILPLPF